MPCDVCETYPFKRRDAVVEWGREGVVGRQAECMSAEASGEQALQGYAPIFDIDDGYPEVYGETAKVVVVQVDIAEYESCIQWWR